jgi:hypothetical protein
MKKLLLILFIITNLCYSQNAQQNIIGEWIATDFDGNVSKMIFSYDNYISMTINGEFVDGKNFVIKGGKNDGQKGFMKYEIDDSSLPIKIDIVAIKFEGGKNIEKGRILGILDFLNKTEMRINMSFSGPRESEFNESNQENTIYLKIK